MDDIDILPDTTLRSVQSFAGRAGNAAIYSKKGYGSRVCHPTENTYREHPRPDESCSPYTQMRDGCCVITDSAADSRFLTNLNSLAFRLNEQISARFSDLLPALQDVVDWAQYKITPARAFKVTLVPGDYNNELLIRFICLTYHSLLRVVELDSDSNRYRTRFQSNAWRIDSEESEIARIVKKYGTLYSVWQYVSEQSVTLPFPWNCHRLVVTPKEADTRAMVDIGGFPRILSHPRLGGATTRITRERADHWYDVFGVVKNNTTFNAVMIEILDELYFTELDAVRLEFNLIPTFQQNVVIPENYTALPPLTAGTFRGVIEPIFATWVEDAFDIFSTWLESNEAKWRMDNQLVAIRLPDGQYMYVEFGNTTLAVGKREFTDIDLRLMVV